MEYTLSVAKWTADATEDTAYALLAFIPNGLADLLGMAFSPNGMFYQVLRWGFLIAIWQALAQELALYLFRPIGFLLGLLIGHCRQSFMTEPQAPYQKGVSKTLSAFALQTVLGALLGMGVLFGAQHIFFQEAMGLRDVLLGALMGATLGLAAKALIMVSIEAVHQANANAVRRNVERAKKLSNRLKAVARQKAKSRILQQAQDIIQQVNGPSAQQQLDQFLEARYETFSQTLYQKVDRHLDYLADRACHGDIKALKRLQELIPKRDQKEGQSSFDVMINRIFNDRTVFQLKDSIDTCYDEWVYKQ